MHHKEKESRSQKLSTVIFNKNNNRIIIWILDLVLICIHFIIVYFLYLILHILLVVFSGIIRYKQFLYWVLYIFPSSTGTMKSTSFGSAINYSGFSKWKVEFDDRYLFTFKLEYNYVETPKKWIPKEKM